MLSLGFIYVYLCMLIRVVLIQPLSLKLKKKLQMKLKSIISIVIKYEQIPFPSIYFVFALKITGLEGRFS
jgi:uncharacterized membrane protein